MADVVSRLIEARKAAGYQRTIDAVRAFGWTRQYYQHENSTRGIPKEALQRYARAYNVSIDWLLTGRGGKARGSSMGVPVIGDVGAGARIYPYSAGALSTIEAPPGSPPEAFALRVVGDSMLPVYEDGMLLICVPCADVMDVVNRRAVVDLPDGARMVKKVRLGSRRGLFNLESANSALIENVKIVRAARVKWIVEP